MKPCYNLGLEENSAPLVVSPLMEGQVQRMTGIPDGIGEVICLGEFMRAFLIECSCPMILIAGSHTLWTWQRREEKYGHCRQDSVDKAGFSAGPIRY